MKRGRRVGSCVHGPRAGWVACRARAGAWRGVATAQAGAPPAPRSASTARRKWWGAAARRARLQREGEGEGGVWRLPPAAAGAAGTTQPAPGATAGAPAAPLPARRRPCEGGGRPLVPASPRAGAACQPGPGWPQRTWQVGAERGGAVGVQPVLRVRQRARARKRGGAGRQRAARAPVAPVDAVDQRGALAARRALPLGVLRARRGQAGGGA